MKAVVFLLVVILNCNAFGQVADTLKLPFAIADEKKLSDEDLKNKKEGTYVTGIPDISSDPIGGFGYGAEGSIFFNGKRSDPFFEYTPYRAELDIVLFNTTRQQREFLLVLDVPYIFNSKWRLRMEAGYEKNPNLLYFGIDDRTLNGLNFYPNDDSTQSFVMNGKYSDYENSLVGNIEHFDTYVKDEFIFNISGERSYLDGKLRALIGFELANFNITALNPNARIIQDSNNGIILGVGKGLVSITQFGLIYDTRDLETDPSEGIFAEITNELSLKSLGSAYDFNKVFVHGNFYHNLIRNNPKKLVAAIRIAGGYTAGAAPFFEFQDQWSSEGSIEGLGGSNTLRGYKQSRFLGRVMTFNNFELRYRFAQTKIWKQHLAFVAVPFFDAGVVGNDLAVIERFKNYRYSEGMGLRLIWNVNTVLRFDYAISKEDRQFFFNLSHAF